LVLLDDARAALANYHFPGNVRELENVLERAVAMAEGSRITAADLALPAAANGVHLNAASANGTDHEHDDPEAPLAAAAEALASARASGALPQALEQIEREAIEQALDAHRWNRTKTAAALGITFRALRYKLKKLGIE